MPSAAQEKSLGSVEYEWNCKWCHAADRKGTSLFEQRSDIAMPDLTTLTQRHDGTFPEDYGKTVIAGSSARAWHTPGQMPAWGLYYSLESYLGNATRLEEWQTEYVEAKIAAVVKYLEGIQVE